MSKEKKVITIIACLVLLMGFSALFWVVYNLREIDYISSISKRIVLTSWDNNDSFAYYWSDSKSVDNSKFVEYEFIETGIVNLSFDKENTKPQTIYLHIEIRQGDDTRVESFEFKNYINKAFDVDLKSKSISIDDPSFVTNIRSNSYSKLETVYVQISENALTSKTDFNRLKFRLLGIFDGKNSSSFDLKLNMQDYNILDGLYYVKISVLDTAGKMTEIYSDKITINFNAIPRLMQFDSPTIGSNGQVVKVSSIRLTGNSLIEVYASEDTSLQDELTSVTGLTLTQKIEDPKKLNARKFNGDIVSLFKFSLIEDSNNYQISSSILVPNGWYYLYYEDEVIGLFLYQLTRGN